MAAPRRRDFFSRLWPEHVRASSLADTHGFLQRRVGLFYRILFGFFALFFLIGIAKTWLFRDQHVLGWSWIVVVGNGVGAALLVLSGAGWVYLRRSVRSAWTLHLFESAGTVVACGLLSLLAPLLPLEVSQANMTLGMVLILVVRAAIVPSTARRTAAVGALATTAMTVAILLGPEAASPSLPGFGEHYMGAFVVVWGVIFTSATGVVSRVIYGLQQEVRAAMQVGNYTLAEKLGEGGMGVVYLAHHALLRRPTAVKLLPPEKAGEQAVARFEREVRETSRLSHPNTVAIYDFGRTPEGICYYAMEYLYGLDLEELVALDGPQPPGRVIHLLAQAAHALSEAHGVGLVHRDVKPSNIVVCNPGGVADVAKVVDFGLVKDLEAPPGLAMTAANVITGTPLYLAPECLTRPEAVDGRADLYALGAVGYYLLTGEHVFAGATAVEVLSQHLHQTPRPPHERLGKAVPADLEAVLLRCLAKEPTDRFPDALSLREALLACEDGSSWGLEQASAWWRQRGDEVRVFREGKRTGLGDGDTVVVTRLPGESP